MKDKINKQFSHILIITKKYFFKKVWKYELPFIILHPNKPTMTIETKFNIGDTAWIMKDNRPLKTEISKIEILVLPAAYDPICYSQYYLTFSEKPILESQIITSKEELLKYL